MNKSNLAKIAGLNTDKIDFALPQEYFNLLNKNHIPTNFIVWNYENKKTFGSPMNIAEEFIYNSQDKIKIDVEKLFTFMEKQKIEMDKIKLNEPFYITLMELIQLLHEEKVLSYEEK
ncbi:MAG: hypothetical protein M0R80_04165 [Proteobacteria bacterium]|nr:hypothetical protein [Pseudomonadota bacterium]